MRSAPINRTTGILLLGALFLCACRQNQTDPKVKIGFGYNSFDPLKDDMLSSLVSRFEKEHQDLRVDNTPFAGSTDTTRLDLLESLRSDNVTVDIFELDEIWTSEFANENLLLPLPLALAEQQRRDSLSAAVEAATVAGKQVALPYFITYGALYYRSDLLYKYGFSPPRTLDELLSTSQSIAKKENMDGFIWQGKNYEGLSCVFFELYYNHGGTVQVVNNSIRLEPAVVAATLSFMRKLIKLGISPPEVLTQDESKSVQHFAQGRAVFMRNWQSLSREVSRGRIGEYYELAPMPGRGISLAGGFHLAVNRRSKNPSQAFALARFLTSRPAQIDMMSKRLHGPVLVELYEQKPLEVPKAKTIGKLASRIRYRPRSRHYHLFSRMLADRIHAYLRGDSTPAVAAEQIVKNAKQPFL